VASPAGEQAIADAIAHGKAVIKFVSKNDAGATGSHQYGFLLPKGCWELFTPHGPTKGTKDDRPVQVTWQDGRVTDSVVKWYGEKTRSEYRLTRLEKDFPFRTADNVGDVLMLIPTGPDTFNGYVLNPEEDLEDIEAELGIDLSIHRWVGYVRGAAEPIPEPQTIEQCIERLFGAYAGAQARFPRGDQLTAETWRVLIECDPEFVRESADVKLVRAKEAEYTLFKKVERLLVWDDISRMPTSVDDYVERANVIVNRRKSRAGRSLENHLGMILRERGIPYDARPDIEGVPDVMIPGKAEYDDPAYPVEKLFVVPVKTTLKDRWGQVLKEAPRVGRKYLFTVQPGISAALLDRMHAAGITLVVPKDIQAEYPASQMEILSIEEFIALVRERLGIA
jgi:EcoRII C terminal/Restriction endonuclease EcoRII, N-terminal